MTSLSLLDAVSILFALAAAAFDVRTQRVSPRWSVAWGAVALVLRGQSEGFGDVEHGVLSGLIAGATSAAFFSILVWRKKFERTDALLMGALGCALGYPLIFAAWVFVSLAGAIEALAFAVALRAVKGRRVPYAVAVFAGLLCTFAWTAASDT